MDDAEEVMFYVSVEFTRPTALLLGEIYGPASLSPAVRIAWRSRGAAIPGVGETVMYRGMGQHPLLVVKRWWEVVSEREVRVILQLGLP